MPQRDFDGFEFLYFDEPRTHELTTFVEAHEPETRLTVLEFPFGSKDPLEVVSRVEVVTEPWEVRLAIKEMEARLALGGVPYYRIDPVTRAIRTIGPARGRSAEELRPHEVAVKDEDGRPVRVRFHHFHRHDGESRLQLTVPRPDLEAERYMLANLDFSFPDVESGDLQLVHPRLAPGTLRQQWLNAHLDLPKNGFRKLRTTSDYAVAFGAGWQETWRDGFRRALRRLMDGDLGPPAAPEVHEVTEDLRMTLADALQSPVLAGIYATHLPKEDEARLLRDGEVPIRRYVNKRRKVAEHRDQAALSLLEAALLTRYGQRVGRVDLVDSDGHRTVRMVQDFERARKVRG